MARKRRTGINAAAWFYGQSFHAAAPTPAKVTIVLARIRIDQVPDGPWAADLGHRPKMREVRRAEGCVWLYEGTDADVVKAKAFATAEGYCVYTYPSDWPQDAALERGKNDCLSGMKGV